MPNAIETRIARLETSINAQGVILEAFIAVLIRKEPDPKAALDTLFEEANKVLDFADDQTDLPQLRPQTAAIRKRVEGIFIRLRRTF